MASSHPLSAAALFSLKGHVAVVTGGGTGVGLMIAQTLAANGAKVYITGRRAEILETSARIHGSPEKLGSSGGSILPLVMDIASNDSVRGAVAEITKSEGFVNVLVNNAGVFGGRTAAKAQDGPEAFSEAMMAESREDNWQKSFDVNVTSQYFVTAAFLPLLAKAASGPTGKVGSVINNCSVSGYMRMSQNCQFAYNASKAAFVHLTRQLAFELSHEQVNVRVNGLALGYFPSEMTTGASNDDNESPAANELFGKHMEDMGARILNRMGTPEEVASVVLMLATNDFVWGTVAIVDGGFTLAVASNM
ncbi:NAD(P)-binding protein [Annulohypoxylon bovei var. microspora]|nr:NAD(P)-binding protein [Annulohypoxylon bovei var. microspora]